jgi:23S rRNA C2498 (ribose-2'-O)-methylase RlmM
MDPPQHDDASCDAQTTSPQDKTVSNSNGSSNHVPSNRLFLGDVQSNENKEQLERQLQTVFEAYGKVLEVFLPERSYRQYAFVTMETVEAAERALVELQVSPPNNQHHPLFQLVEPALTRLPRNAKRLKRTQQDDDDLQQTLKWMTKSNVVCQLDKSHVTRLVDVVQNSKHRKYQVIGDTATKSKTVSLVYCHAGNCPQAFVSWIQQTWFVHPVVHRMVVVEQQVQGALTRDLVPAILKRLSQLILETTAAEEEEATTTTTTTSPMRMIQIRLQLFPPKLTNPLLAALESQWERFEHKEQIAFSPTNPTHSLGILQLYKSQSDNNDHGVYAMGVSRIVSAMTAPGDNQFTKPNDNDNDNNNNNNNPSSKSNICRAYWKLQEALERYDHELPSSTDKTLALTALDCGAAPGGWTKCLSERFQNCKRIYSVDPGKLDEEVLCLPNVQHLALTIKQALPKLKADNVTIDIWVSDMCVKDLEQQIDWLLEARKVGVVGQGTFVVLTMKCIVGHSHATFDHLVREQQQRLSPIAEKLQSLHLFSNRSSERTIVGYLT